MAIETPQEPAAALAGLDQLELAPPQQAKRHLGAKVWAAAWPKLLALVLALAIWELVYLSGFKSAILPGPATTLANLWDQLHHALLWQAIGTTLRRAVIGFALALVIGTVVGALVSRIRPLRAAVGSLITARADAAVDRLGPVRDHPVRRQHDRDPVRHRDDRRAGDRQRADRRGGLRAAAAAAGGQDDGAAPGRRCTGT